MPLERKHRIARRDRIGSSSTSTSANATAPVASSARAIPASLLPFWLPIRATVTVPFTSDARRDIANACITPSSRRSASADASALI
jgi:hypothetical protein